MDRTLTNFIHSLRMAEIRVSPAETLDALNTVELVGYRDREFLKHSLAMVLPKTIDEKDTFDACFDQFFAFEELQSQRGEENNADEHGDEEGAEEGEGQGQGEGGGVGGERQPGQPASGDRKKKKKKPSNNLYEEEEEEDLGPGEMSQAESKLGQQLMNNSIVELTTAMAAAGEAVNVREIQIFTQKGVGHVMQSL